MEQKTKKINAKVIHKCETEANWELSSYIPAEGEVVTYKIDENYDYERMKLGDGIHAVKDLPFMGANTFVPRMHTTDDANGLTREYLIKNPRLVDGMLPRTTDNHITVEELGGKALMVRAVPPEDSELYASAWSYIDADGLPIQAPKYSHYDPAIGLATPTVIISTSDPIYCWNAIDGAVAYELLIGDVCQYNKTYGSFVNTHNRLFAEMSRGRGVYNNYTITNRDIPLDPDPDGFALGHHLDSIPKRLGDNHGVNPTWLGHILVPTELTLPDNPTSTEIDFYDSSATSHKVVEDMIHTSFNDFTNVPRELSCITPISSKYLCVDKTATGSNSQFYMKLNNTDTWLNPDLGFEGTFTWTYNSISSGLQIQFKNNKTTKVVMMIRGGENSMTFGSVANATNAEVIVPTQIATNYFASGKTFKITIKIYQSIGRAILYINGEKIGDVIHTQFKDAEINNVAIYCTNGLTTNLIVKSIGFNIIHDNPEDIYDAGLITPFDFSDYLSLPAWDINTTDIGTDGNNPARFYLSTINRSLMATNVKYIDTKIYNIIKKDIESLADDASHCDQLINEFNTKRAELDNLLSSAAQDTIYSHAKEVQSIANILTHHAHYYYTEGARILHWTSLIPENDELANIFREVESQAYYYVETARNCQENINTFLQELTLQNTTAADAGKIPMVNSNGRWELVSLQYAEGVKF